MLPSQGERTEDQTAEDVAAVATRPRARMEGAACMFAMRELATETSASLTVPSVVVQDSSTGEWGQLQHSC